MKKIVKFKAGFDRRDPDPKKNYGIHGLEISFALKNYKGAVQFLLYTNWLPVGSPDLKWFEKIFPKEIKDPIGPMFVALVVNPFMPSVLSRPTPADLCYHSPKQKYEDQLLATDKCEYLGGKPCYYDGSGLNAVRIYEVLLNEGEEGLWRELQNFHENVFGEPIIKRLIKIPGKIIRAYLKFTGADESIRNLKAFFEKKKKGVEITENRARTEKEGKFLKIISKINGETITLIISIAGFIITLFAISTLLSGGKI